MSPATPMRISATTLESFRLYMDPEQEWMDEADIVATIRGEFVASPAMLLGRAFGEILEHPDRYRVIRDGDEMIEVTGYQNGLYTFDAATMAPVLALIDRRGVFEAKAEKHYSVAHDEAVVATKADYLLGSSLTEFKTSDYFDFDKYEPSLQWRFMVDIFEPTDVTYHVFKLDDHENGVIEVKAIDSFALYPYASCHDDCLEWLEDFVRFVKAKRLDGLLRARQQKAMEVRGG